MDKIELRRHRLGPGERRAGALHDPRSRPLLRWHGQGQERPQHDDDELRRDGHHLGGLGALGLQRDVRRVAGRDRGQPVPALRPRRGHDAPSTGRIPGAGVRGLPGGLRDHHRRAHLRRHRRSREVHGLDRLHRRLGDDRLLPGRALGVRVRRLRGDDRWLDRQRHQGGRLRRAARRSTSTPVPPAWLWRWSWASASGSPRSPCVRTT